MTLAAVTLLAVAAVGGEYHSLVETPRGWALRAGDGQLWRARGVEKVNANGPFCGSLGRPYASAINRAGLSRDQWCAQTAERLKAWGFNSLGTSCDKHLNKDGFFAETEMIALSSWMRDKGEDHVIAVAPNSPCGPLANVFHPDFEAVCETAAKTCCAPRRDKRGFLGYYLDNERNWWGCGNWWECGMLDAALTRLPARHPARLEAERILSETPDRATARRLYTERLAERYFATIAAAIRRHDPNHLIVGCRFAGIAGPPDVVWRACARHCDVVSLNCYPNANLTNGQLTLRVCPALLPSGVARTGQWTDVPLEVMLSRRYEVCGKPLLISEWSFRGADVGRPRAESNGQQLADQRQRAEAVKLFLREMERLPFVVGHFFYKWTDDLFPASDGGSPETLNWGLVLLDDVPHERVAAAFAAIAAMRASGAQQSSMPPVARFGVLSDVHVTTEGDSRKIFEHALRYYDEMKCDGVLLCGDIADYGLVDELKCVGDTWFKVFPEGRRSDGQPVAQLFIYGDHDMGGYMHTRVEAKNHPERVIPLTGPAEAWETAFHEKWSPIQVKTVKGYTFILAHHPLHNKASEFGQKIPGVEEALTRYAPRDDKPFFFLQHRIYRDTVGGLSAWGQESGASRAALDAYPNAIALCGHGHVECQDEMSIWQDTFTAVEIPSLRYVSIRAGRENSRGHDDVPSKQQPMINTGGGKQGLLMEVYSDRIVFAKRDFVNDCEIAAPWVVPLPFPSGRPYNFAARAVTEVAPQFPKGAKVSVKRRKGKDRAGNDQEQFVVLVNPVHSTATTPRAFDYEVTAEIAQGDVIRIAKQKRFFSYNGHFPEQFDNKPTGFNFAKSELSAQAERIRFHVRPCGPFGAKGAAIVSEWERY